MGGGASQTQKGGEDSGAAPTNGKEEKKGKRKKEGGKKRKGKEADPPPPDVSVDELEAERIVTEIEEAESDHEPDTPPMVSEFVGHHAASRLPKQTAAHETNR